MMTPFCSHCRNLGLSTANTHWLRDGRGLNAKVICPELLKTQCRYCKETGHTISHCTQLRVQNQVLLMGNTKSSPQLCLAPPKITRVRNMFAALDVEDPEHDSDEEGGKETGVVMDIETGVVRENVEREFNVPSIKVMEDRLRQGIKTSWADEV